MYNNEPNSDSLDAGAPEIRLTGNQDPNKQMASYGYDDAMAESRQAYDDARQKGVIPIDMPFEDFLDLMQEGGFLEGKAPQQDSGIMAAAPQTYTQNRKQMMAYGGIAGADGRKKYGIGSWIQKNVMDPIKHATIGEEATKALSEARVAREDALYGENYTPGYEQIFDIFRTDENKKGDSNFDFSSLINNPLGNIFFPNQEDSGTGTLPLNASAFGLGNINLNPYIKQVTKEKMNYVPATEGKYVQAGPPGSDSYQVYVPGRAAIQGSPEESTRSVNPLYPIAAGLGVGKYVSGLPKDTLPMDTTSIDPAAIAAAARGTDAEGAAAGLRFLPEQVTRAAQGGRIGYNRGRVVNPGGYAGELSGMELFNNLYKMGKIDNLQLALEDARRYDAGEQTEYEKLTGEDPLEIYQKYSDPSEVSLGSGLAEEAKQTIQGQADKLQKGIMESGVLDDLDLKAQGGRIGAQEGGLMNLGGMEKDYRAEGGFVPIGGKEKADDVPARLSKNEFVFTADAVRGAGGGDIDKGAEIMEDLMKRLEGARGMFANAQELEKRII